MYTGVFDKARRRCEELRLKDTNNPEPRMLAAQIEFFGRNFDRAEQLYAELMEKDRTGGVNCLNSIRFLSAVGFVHRSHGLDDSEMLLKEAIATDEKELSAAPANPALSYSLAASYAAAGKSELAVSTLERAIEAGWVDVRSIQTDPRFDDVRSALAFERAAGQLRDRLRAMAAHIAEPREQN